MPIVRRGSPFVVSRRAGYAARRGMGAAGQTDPCACQYQLPGVTPIAGLPTCDPTTGTAPSCTAAEGNMPFCAGIPYGQPGYSQCVAADAASTTVGGIGTPAIVNPASYNAILASIPTTPPAKSNQAAAATPAQSNAPASTSVGSSNPSQTVVQSNAPAPSTVTPTPALASSAGCFGFFAGEPCLGPIGLYTLLTGGAAVVVLMLMFGGHHR
jgi:hypothetical protein